MRHTKTLASGYCLVLSFFGMAPALPELTLDQLLDRMSEKGAGIQALQARITQKKWTEILEEFDLGEEGTFLFLRSKEGVYLRKDIEQPQPNHLIIGDGQAVFYQPAIKQAQRYSLGQSSDRAEFLLLGFGSSRQALEDSYDIHLTGREMVRGNETYVLELVPKSSGVSAFFSKIVLWVDPDLWVPVQQRLVEPTDDYLLVSFEAIQLNPRLSPSDFRLKLPKDVRVVGN